MHVNIITCICNRNSCSPLFRIYDCRSTFITIRHFPCSRSGPWYVHHQHKNTGIKGIIKKELVTGIELNLDRQTIGILCTVSCENGVKLPEKLWLFCFVLWFVRVLFWWSWYSKFTLLILVRRHTGRTFQYLTIIFKWSGIVGGRRYIFTPWDGIKTPWMHDYLFLFLRFLWSVGVKLTSNVVFQLLIMYACVFILQ